MVRRTPIVVATDAAGAGTALSPWPVSGLVVEVRLPDAGSTLTVGGSADFTVTRVGDGGTVLAVTSQAAPFEFYPRKTGHTTAGGSVGADALIPVDDYLQAVVAQGAASASGTLYIHTREDR